MAENDWLADRFEADRPRLRAVAYRMLGSLDEADDALQEAWIHASRAGIGGIDNLSGWLTTVVARVCLDMLRSRRARREETMAPHMPDPCVSAADAIDPEQGALVGDWLGLALLVVLDTLAPAERVAFVLHDVFGLPFDEIGPIVGRSPVATRQLASRARRRVRGVTEPHPDLTRQREVVAAFLAAARDGDFEALLTLLDPDVVLRADAGAAAASRVVRGAAAVAKLALTFYQYGPFARPALVNGTPGVVAAEPGRVYSVVGVTVRAGRITEIDILADPERLRELDLRTFDDRR